MLTFEKPLVKGLFIKREKRFFARIQLIDGNEVHCYCPNTGRMTGLLIPGAVCWIREQSVHCKLRFAWELVTLESGLACVNTHRANDLLATESGNMPLSWSYPYYLFKREPVVGSHRFDLELIHQTGKRVLVEIKTVTLQKAQKGYFPDAPSKRAHKHLKTMIDLVDKGMACWLVFVVMVPEVNQVFPAFWIDPLFTSLMKDAENRGVKILAFTSSITPNSIKLGRQIPVLSG